jgi:hypothetical protein
MKADQPWQPESNLWMLRYRFPLLVFTQLAPCLSSTDTIWLRAIS